MASFRSLLQRVPPLYRAQRRLRDHLHRGTLDRLERQISARGGYEILVVFGMRRSGNHLTIGWILDQVPGNAVFYNNIRPGADPLSARMTEYRKNGAQEGHRVVLSYEDVSVDEMLQPALTDFLSERVAHHGARVRFAVILRDPLNLFASRLQKWPERFGTEAQITAQQTLYAEHAALAAAPAPIWRAATLVPVLYNHLLSDPATRITLADALEIQQGDRGLDRMSVYGHGSSFDGLARDSADVAQDVFSRWHSQAENPAFQAAIAHPEVAKAGETLFNMSAPQTADKAENPA